MSRLASAPVAALFLCTVLASPALAQGKPAPQAKPAAPAATAPAAPAKWVPPVKGTATIEVMRVGSRKVGNDLVTTIKVKNTSTGSINLLRVDELWYDEKREMVTSATERWKKPFLPGEIIEMQLKSPILGKPVVSQMTFQHANGKIEQKTVKKMQ